MLRNLLAMCTIVAAGAPCAQDYPSKTVRIVTGGAGSGTDFTSRQLAQGIAGPLGQPVIVDNRTAPISSDIVSKASPEGYTLMVQGGALEVTPLPQKMPYDNQGSRHQSRMMRARA